MDKFDREQHFRWLGRYPKYFIKDEIDMILASASSIRNRLIISFMWRTGCRVSEMLAVRVNDIDRHIKAIRIHSLKQKSSRGSNDPIRVVPLQSDFLDELLTYISDNRIKSSDRLFQIGRAMVHRIVKDTCKKAGYADSRAHPHTFRHSFAIHCLLNSTPIEVVQKVLGHRLLSTTMIYAQIIGADARPFLEGIQW